MNIDKLVKEYYRRTKKRREIVKQNSYLDWLYDYVCKNKSIDNESILYSENVDNFEIYSSHGDLIEKIHDVADCLYILYLVSIGEYPRKEISL